MRIYLSLFILAWFFIGCKNMKLGKEAEFDINQKMVCEKNLQVGFIPLERGSPVEPFYNYIFQPLYDTVNNKYVTIKYLDYFNNIDEKNLNLIDTLAKKYRYQFTNYKDLNIPENHLQYSINYFRSSYYGLVSLVDIETNEPVKLPSLKKKFKFFPDSISIFENSFLLIQRNPSFFGCTSELDTIEKTPYHSSFLPCRQILDFSFGFFEGIYESKLYCLWESEYKMFLRCRKITAIENCSDLEKNLRDYISASTENNYLMHKSFFEIVLWQLYKPRSLDINDNTGKSRSFLFTSCNPEYPGNYEVKFNIYEPYRLRFSNAKHQRIDSPSKLVVSTSLM